MTNKERKPGTFKKNDPRINRNGRPKSFDALRSLAQHIAHEEATSGNQPIIINGKKVTIAEAIMRKWAGSNNPQLQKAFIEVAFGKVPDELNMRGDTIVKVRWDDATSDD